MTNVYDILLFFVKEQSKVLEEKTGIKDIEDEDIKEIYTWDVNIIDKFLRNLCDDHILDDVTISPWCCKHISNCRMCSYGKRHGKCGHGHNESSTYGKILIALEYNELNSLEEIQNIISSVQESYRNLLYKNKLKKMLK